MAGGQYSIKINRFDGGLNTKDTPQHGNPNQSPDMQNVVFDDLGAVKTRLGFTTFNTEAIGVLSYAVDGLHSYVTNSGTARLMAGCAGSLWRASNSTFVTVGSAQSVWTAGVPLQMDTFQNLLFMSNGYVNPYKFNGTEFTRWGVPVCSAPAAAASITAGNPNGTYKYVVLGINSYSVQGNYGSACADVVAASVKVRVSDIPVFPTSAGVNTKAICRNTAAASGIYYIITSIANADTVFLDNVADAALSADDLAPTNNGLPVNFTVFIHHMQRMFGANKNGSYPMYLYYSEIDAPETWASDHYIKIDDGDGLPIVGLAALNNGIVIAKNNGKGSGSVYFLYTPDATPANWSMTRIETRNSTEATRVMCEFGDYIMMLNRNGVYDLNQTAIGAIASDPLSYNIEPDIYALATSYLSAACAITWKNKVWLSVPYGSTTVNNRVYQYDFVKGRNEETRAVGAWSRFTGLGINNFAVFNSNLYGGTSAATGYVYKLDTGYSDNGTAIDSYYKTMVISGNKEHENNTKMWRKLVVLVECSGAWNMELTYLDPYSDESGTTAYVDVNSGGALWGTIIWGTDAWGAQILRKKATVVFNNMVTTSIQLKFRTQNANQYFKVSEVEVFYNLLGVR